MAILTRMEVRFLPGYVGATDVLYRHIANAHLHPVVPSSFWPRKSPTQATYGLLTVGSVAETVSTRPEQSWEMGKNRETPGQVSRRLVRQHLPREFVEENQLITAPMDSGKSSALPLLYVKCVDRGQS